MDKTKNPISATRAVATSIAVSIGDIVLNTIVSVVTGSVVMLAQALQGVADLLTSVLLMVGVRSSKRQTSAKHPFGYGREVFFWTLLASIFTLFITGGLAIVRGLDQIRFPGLVENTGLAYTMLTFGLVTNAYALSLSFRRISQKAKDHKFLDYLLRSSLVETKSSLLVDLMGTISAFLGIMAIALFDITGNVFFDGVGAVSVGVLTAIGAGLLIYNLRGFIIGQSPSQDVIEQIRKYTLQVENVNDVLDLRAVTIGSEQLLVILEVHFADNLSTDQVEATTDAVKSHVKKHIPIISRIQVEAETPN